MNLSCLNNICNINMPIDDSTIHKIQSFGFTNGFLNYEIIRTSNVKSIARLLRTADIVLVLEHMDEGAIVSILIRLLHTVHFVHPGHV